MHTLFISDLHLDPDRPETIGLFLEFLAHRAQGADALYILGDFFDVWIGDDYTPAGMEQTIYALKAYSQHHPLFMLHGNRDFLMAEEFERITGCQLLPDPHMIQLYGQKVLISHGDQLCIDDHDYMKWRQISRSPQWQQDFLEKPLAERIAFAQAARSKSKQVTLEASEEIMDVNQQEVERVMQEHNVRLLIHGHTHRPDVHTLTLNSKVAQRIVLGDWHENQGCVLNFSPQGHELEFFGSKTSPSL